MNNKISALKGKVLVDKIESGERRTRNGVILLDDNGKPWGIRERWAQIYAVGPDVYDVEPGQWILIKHGRWGRGVPFDTLTGTLTLRQVDFPDAILLVSDEQPSEVVVV
tara:strand:- start:4606 stop:4932 length:327 start_codon:yes stop_codon:yes gene_type:complete